MFVLAVAYLLGLLWCLCSGRPLYRNWKHAKKLGLPLILSPTSPGTPLWQFLRYILDGGMAPAWLARLSFARLMRSSWNFVDKFSLHQEYGKIVILVNPTGCELYVADRDVARQILSRRNDFPKPTNMLSKLDMFGKNVASAEGIQWQRHRKVTASSLHEKVNEVVWVESSKEAYLRLKGWTGAQYIQTTRSDMATLSINVLSKACLDKNKGQGPDDGILSGDVASCHHHLNIFLNDIIRPRGIDWWGEDRRKMIGNIYALGGLLAKLVDNRKKSLISSSHTDLISSMLATSGKGQLSDNEITGNLFMFIFAGHETTANALVYIIYLFAIFPCWQEWALEEVDRLCHGSATDGLPEYEATYPQIQRLRAILYETLRLYGPVPTIPRKSNEEDQIVISSQEEIVVPKNTRVNINAMSLHTDPHYWGSDSLDWSPSRWITEDTNFNTKENICPEKSKSLFAWADGPRVCPGQKFSQVEVFGVLLRLLRSHTVKIVPAPGQTMQQAQAHAFNLIQNSRIGLTLHIKNSESVRLQWIKR